MKERARSKCMVNLKLFLYLNYQITFIKFQIYFNNFVSLKLHILQRFLQTLFSRKKSRVITMKHDVTLTSLLADLS